MASSRTPLTPRQARLLVAIEELTARTGYPPTFMELSAELGLATKQGAMFLARRLQARGSIEWNPRMQRTIRLSSAGRLELGIARALVDMLPQPPAKE